MASPLRRGNKIYFRKAVPKDLQPILEKAEIKISLRTSSVEEARPEFARLNAEWEQTFQSLRREHPPLDYEGAAALAGEIYRHVVDSNKKHPDPDGLLRARTHVDGYLAGDRSVRSIPRGDPVILDKMDQALRNSRRHMVRNLLLSKGVNLRPEDLDLVVKAANPAVFAAKKRLVALSEFSVEPDRVREQFPDWVPPQDRFAEPGEKPPVKYDLLAIFDNMSRERGHAPSTRDRWRPIVEKVAETHPDIRTIGEEWCVEYKDGLVASGLSTKTIKEANLAALKNLLNFAVTNKLIPASPMHGLTVKVKQRALLRSQKGYTDAEAKIVLAATNGSFSNLLPPDQHEARRWIPRLGYYMGARGGELAQLRKQDFRKEDGVWIAHITPEAGPVKTGEPRDVAVHEHLIEMGLIDFVLNCPRDTLFYDASRKRAENPKNPPQVKTAENLSRWIRSLGLKDEQLQPNHGWRHRFTTIARTVDMDTEFRRYIQGHVPEDEASKYGNYPPKALHREIMKIPRYDLRTMGDLKEQSESK